MLAERGIPLLLKVRYSGAMGSSNIPPLGLEPANRALLTRLHRAFAGPFDLADAAVVLDLSRDRVRRLLAYLAARGWLVRVRRGLYAVVPLEAEDPSAWLADPWVVASRSFAPCYIGGWTALHHWELTEQLFRTVVVFTATPVRRSTREIQGTSFRLKQVDEQRLFGLSKVWRGRVAVDVSDAERTLVDCFDRPELGGGIRHVADCLQEWFERDAGDRVSRLLDDADRLGNRTVFKRLGFVLEARGLGSDDLLETCRGRMSQGVSPLDPSAAGKGRIVKRWRLRVNARV